MQLYVPQPKLQSLIRTKMKSSIESHQVAQRLLKLLPLKLAEITRKHRLRKYSSAKSLRLALTDPDYLKLAGQYLAVANQSIEAKVLGETHMMLFQARQSIRKHASRSQR